MADKLLSKVRTGLRWVRAWSRIVHYLNVARTFDADFYLELYPDVAQAGLDPYLHYLRYGLAEGRIGRYGKAGVEVGRDALPCYSGDFGKLDAEKDIVLVVSHEASRTGAPVLSLNIVQELSTRYNVIALLLGGGALLGAFARSSDIVVGPVAPYGNEALVARVVDALLRKVDIRFAIVNSVEARLALPELARHFVATIALIHEFASYTRPSRIMSDAIFWAGEVVFPARIVWENAKQVCPHLADRPCVIIPQGKSVIANHSIEPAVALADATRIREAFRPSGCPQDTIVVIGAGTVQLRKGVDLFIACAARVSRASGGRRCRFVWVGHGYDPEADSTYSVYLADQVARSGLQDCFVFLDEVSQIEEAYRQADVLLISSRLDPLPNVAIDAMTIGLPVLCFEEATGAADLLTGFGLGDECVAPYLDIEAMASRVLHFIDHPESRARVGQELARQSVKLFDMSSYVKTIEERALAQGCTANQERADCATIGGAGALNSDFMPSSWSEMLPEAMVRLYVRSWRSGVDLRKPLPGFHPGVYLERHGVSELGRDPLADFLAAGRPRGPWLFDVINSAAVTSRSHPAMRVALHLHIYYSDLADDIFQRLSANTARPDLLISVPRHEVVDELKAKARDHGYEAEIQVVPNRGRDIGPLLTAFGDVLVRDYDLIGHIHSKKSEAVKDASMGRNWFLFLLENLVGGRHAMADIIVSQMMADSSLGLVFPDDPFVMGWTLGKAPAWKLAERLRLRDLPERHFNFPVGTMFWARVEAIRPLIDLHLGWQDYPPEPLPYDGTLLHSIERLLPFVAEKAGYRLAVTHVPGVTR